MAARDLFHDAVKNALQKEEWTVTHDPLTIKVGGVGMEIDLGAEKLIAAEKGNEKIAIEIKSFVRPSAVSEFHAAVGQYMNYRKALGKSEPDRMLYLAVPKETYNSFFTLPFISECIADYNLKIIVYDPKKEAVTAWKN
ncbi:MAG: fatty-acid oxidation protein subunit alpha [Candidatus Electrothrix sp. AUS1_2]|nr:fatty-acid oxidation protein subunit alpha [Candidatus Electrothrix sp. AUS1_2]